MQDLMKISQGTKQLLFLSNNGDTIAKDANKIPNKFVVKKTVWNIEKKEKISI